MAPSKVKEVGAKKLINDKAYKRLITGLNKRFWQVVYNGICMKEASKMDADELLEAHAALRTINEEIRDEFENKEGGVSGGRW